MGRSSTRPLNEDVHAQNDVACFLLTVGTIFVKCNDAIHGKVVNMTNGVRHAHPPMTVTPPDKIHDDVFKAPAKARAVILSVLDDAQDLCAHVCVDNWRCLGDDAHRNSKLVSPSRKASGFARTPGEGGLCFCGATIARDPRGMQSDSRHGYAVHTRQPGHVIPWMRFGLQNKQDLRLTDFTCRFNYLQTDCIQWRFFVASDLGMAYIHEAGTNPATGSGSEELHKLKKPRADQKATKANINKILDAAGRDERVQQGKGYVYFYGGDADGWFTSTVPVCWLGHLTVGNCIAHFNDMAGTSIDV
jgi:hypothetical protein